MNVQSQKQPLRQLLRSKRKNFHGKDLANQNIIKRFCALLAHEFSHKGWQDGVSQNKIKQDIALLHIGLYYPVGAEASLLGLLDDDCGQYNFCLPKVFGVDIRFLLWKQKEKLIDGYMGIPTPIGEDFIIPDIVCVPLIGFTEDKKRLGQGGGYYDRFIGNIRNEGKRQPLWVGIAFECQKLLSLPVEAHDQALDYIITEDRLY